MGIRVRHGLSLLSVVFVGFASGNEFLKEKFDTEQNVRLLSLQTALKKGNQEELRKLANSQSKTVEEALKDYDTFGRHQRLAAADYASALMAKGIFSEISTAISVAQPIAGAVPSQLVTFAANDYAKKTYGLELKYNDKTKKWDVSPGSNPEMTRTKVKEVLAKNIDKKVWDSMAPDTQNIVVNKAIQQLNADFQSLPPLENSLNPKLLSEFKKKAAEFGNADKGRIAELNAEIVAARVNDVAERRMLLKEKKATESLKEGETENLADFCSEFVGELVQEDIQRKINAGGTNVPCGEPLKIKLAALEKDDGGRRPAVEDSRLLASEKADAKEEDEEEEEHPDGEKKKEPRVKETDAAAAKRKIAEEAKRAKKADTNTQDALANENTQLKQALIDAQSREQNALGAANLAQMCQRDIGASKDPLGLTPNNEKNEKVLTSLMQKMEETISDNAVATFCKSTETTGLTQVAASQFLEGLGVPSSGGMTEAQQKTAMGMAQRFIENAGKLIRNKGTEMRARMQMVETASKRALTRVTMEYGHLLNLNTVSYLKGLSHSELVGVDGMGFGGALTKASTTPQDPSMLIQVYNDFYETAMLDLKGKFGSTGEEFEKSQACSMTLAQAAASRWSEEANRSITLMSPIRQGSLRSLNSLLGNPTDVKNAPSNKTRPLSNQRNI